MNLSTPLCSPLYTCTKYHWQNIIFFPCSMWYCFQWGCGVYSWNSRTFSKAASMNKGASFIIAAVSVVYLCIYRVKWAGTTFFTVLFYNSINHGGCFCLFVCFNSPLKFHDLAVLHKFRILKLSTMLSFSLLFIELKCYFLNLCLCWI